MLVTAVCVSVCLSLTAFPHYFTDPGVIWGNGRRCPLVVHYWADFVAMTTQRRVRNVSECLYSVYAWLPCCSIFVKQLTRKRGTLLLSVAQMSARDEPNIGSAHHARILTLLFATCV